MEKEFSKGTTLSVSSGIEFHVLCRVISSVFGFRAHTQVACLSQDFVPFSIRALSRPTVIMLLKQITIWSPVFIITVPLA